MYDPRQFGAVGDGRALDSQAVQRAVDAAHAAGGGTVVLSPGRYRCGTVRLKSHVTLHLERGATLLGSTDIADYAADEWGHHNDITPWHLILAKDAHHIAITGHGTIDGSGPAFWEPTRRHEWAFWKERLQRVSPMVQIHRCAHVRVDGVTLRESAGWTLHLHDCDHVSVHGITIRNTFFGPNTDGIDITGSQYVTISDCDIATGDDGIALKTSEYSRACENIAINNCLIQTSCVGLRIGFESRQDFRNIVASNLIIPRCSRVLDLRSIEGSVIENVVVSNVIASTNSGWPVNRPIELSLHSVPNAYKAGLHAGHPDFGRDRPLTKVGAIRDVTLRDIDIQTDGRCTFVADKGLQLSDVRIEGLRLRYVMLDDVSPFGARGGNGFLFGDHGDARTAAAALVLKNAQNVHIAGLDVRWPTYPVPEGWHLLNSDNRAINADYYLGHESAVKSGLRACRFGVIWARNVSGSCESGHRLASDGSPGIDSDGFAQL